jgi:hypothetical protein
MAAAGGAEETNRRRGAEVASEAWRGGLEVEMARGGGAREEREEVAGGGRHERRLLVLKLPREGKLVVSLFPLSFFRFSHYFWIFYCLSECVFKSFRPFRTVRIRKLKLSVKYIAHIAA